MFNPGQPNWLKTTGNDVPYQRTIDLVWFTRVLYESGYKPYRLTPDDKSIAPIIVWAKPVVALFGWTKAPTTAEDRMKGWQVDMKDVPQIGYIEPDISRIAKGRVEAVPGLVLNDEAYIILVDGEDGPYTNYVNWSQRRELLSTP